MPLYFTSASDGIQFYSVLGSNVVSIFQEAMRQAIQFKHSMNLESSGDFVQDVLHFIESEKAQGGLFEK